MPMPSTTMNTTTSMSDMPAWDRLVGEDITSLPGDCHGLAGAYERHRRAAYRARLAKRVKGERRGGRAQGDIARRVELLRDLDHCRPSIRGTRASIVVADVECIGLHTDVDRTVLRHRLALREPHGGHDLLRIPRRLALAVRELRDRDRRQNRRDHHHDDQLDQR